MIVADTGAVVALIDRDDAHHRALLALFKKDPYQWLLPWAILPEVDYLLTSYVGIDAEREFVSDIANGSFRTDWGVDEDLRRADELNRQYKDLKLGLVDTIVMAIAERTRADAIATIDERHFGAVLLEGAPRLLPRDL
ncbi:MAG TPA: PIN domain-containing protein [Vicinamibacteria bacterium]|nr:PIN domain-containing protein [Vicinamibacteria bacterium]